MILSHFYNITNLLGQITDESTLRLALTESAKLLPYVIGSRKCVKGYIKVFFMKNVHKDGFLTFHGQKCLDLWSSAGDPIRVVAFLSIRKLAASGDESIIDGILKVPNFLCETIHDWSYLSLVYILDSAALLKIYKPLYPTFHQSHEKLCVGCLLLGSCNSLPARLWIYPSTCHPFEK